jgi:hypothetical protein
VEGILTSGLTEQVCCVEQDPAAESGSEEEEVHTWVAAFLPDQRHSHIMTSCGNLAMLTINLPGLGLRRWFLVPKNSGGGDVQFEVHNPKKKKPKKQVGRKRPRRDYREGHSGHLPKPGPSASPSTGAAVSGHVGHYGGA